MIPLTRNQFGRFTYETMKIHGSSVEELQREINSIEGKILSIEQCTPDWTDTDQWYAIFVEKSC